MYKKNFWAYCAVNMKILKVIDIDLYDRLMSLLRDQRGGSDTMTEPTSPTVQQPNVLEINKETPQRPAMTSSDTVACTCVMHTQLGEGIKPMPPENWMSFKDFVRKRKQLKVTKKKTKERSKKCRKQQRGRS